MFLREGETWSREPRFRSARSCLCMRGGETSPPLWIPFEPCKPDEGANLTAEDEASFTFRRPSPGPFVPPALRRSLRPEELQLWGRYNHASITGVLFLSDTLVRACELAA